MARTNDGSSGNRFGTVATKYALPTNATFLWRCKLSNNVSVPVIGQRSNANAGFAITRNQANQSLRMTTFGYTDMDFDFAAWPADGAWHSYYVTKSGNDYAFFIDNLAKGTFTASGFSVPENDIPLGVGSYYYESTGLWDSIMGSLAEVAVIDRVLTTGERAEWTAGESPGLFSGCINYWRLDAASGNEPDYAGSLTLTQTGTMGSETHPTMNYSLRPHRRSFKPTAWNVLHNPR